MISMYVFNESFSIFEKISLRFTSFNKNSSFITKETEQNFHILNEQLQQEIIDLVKAAMSNDEQAIQYIQKIMEAAQTGDPKAAEMA